MKPFIGVPTLLVYRECPEGCWCATGEGELPPLCATHGLQMFPGCAPDGKNRYGTDSWEHRKLRGLGFAATLTNEIAALEQVQRQRTPGLREALQTRPHLDQPAEPYYSKLEIETMIEASKPKPCEHCSTDHTPDQDCEKSGSSAGSHG